ncbi:hypothetical protein DFS33DRAFT_1450908 [Desarmillaria ectypa]|nr:hypothetical protein DFS33DRAFT_1450908 [Desarmillaria ectypa]
MEVSEKGKRVLQDPSYLPRLDILGHSAQKEEDPNISNPPAILKEINDYSCPAAPDNGVHRIQAGCGGGGFLKVIPVTLSRMTLFLDRMVYTASTDQATKSVLVFRRFFLGSNYGNTDDHLVIIAYDAISISPRPNLVLPGTSLFDAKGESLWDHLSTSICAVSGVDINHAALSNTAPRNKLRLEGIQPQISHSPLFRTDGNGTPYLFSGFPIAPSVDRSSCSSPYCTKAFTQGTNKKFYVHGSRTTVSSVKFIHGSVFSFTARDEHRVHRTVDSVKAVHLDAVSMP